MTAQLEEEIGDELPSALYRLYAADGALLYVGVTSSLKARLAQHATAKPWWGDVARKTVTWHSERQVALDAEVAAIREERPRYNIQEARTRAEREAAGGPATDRHKYRPISFRPSAEIRAWLMVHAEETGLPVRAVLALAVAEYRERVERGGQLESSAPWARRW